MSLTVFLTVISGTLVYVLGQIINKFYIEPIYKLKKTTAEISDALLFYNNLYTSPIDKVKNKFDRPNERKEASRLFRNLACKIKSDSCQIPSYRDFVLINIIPGKKNIQEIASNLIGLSNSMWPESGTYNLERTENLEKLLNVRIE